MIEKQTDKEVKYLRTDNGLEFCGEVFNNFCRKSGITRHKTVTYTPQQNGVAKRLNKTIMKRVRCLLSNVILEEKFSAEAAVYVVYTLNRSPPTSLRLLTSEEKWSKHPPSLSDLKVCGCVGYVHQNKGKLKARATRCMFVGFTERVKGFKLWHPTNKKFIISMDILFRESEMFMQGKINTERNSDDTESYTTQIEVENTRNSAQPIEEPTVAEQEQVENFSEEQTGIIEEQPDLSQYSLARDRKRRVIVPPARYVETGYISFILNATVVPNDSEPSSFKEVVNGSNARQWIEAMNE